MLWRRGRDSNPRYGCPYAAFRVRCDRPLCHLSVAPVSINFSIPIQQNTPVGTCACVGLTGIGPGPRPGGNGVVMRTLSTGIGALVACLDRAYVNWARKQ